MNPRNSTTRTLLIGWLVLLALARFVRAENWPEGYVVYEETQSPDGRYGILVPTADAWEKDPSLEEKNYFADLKNHRLLGKISGADYFAHQNHRGLKTVWAADSSWCIAQYDDRFGFSSIALFEPKETRFVQTDMGERIQKTLAAAMRVKGDTEGGGGGDGMPYYRTDPSGKVRVRVTTTTDTKELDLKHARFGYFRGTFDIHSKKWLGAEARRVDYDDYNHSDFGDIDEDMAHTTFEKVDDKLQSLDERMNGTYGFLRTVLPPARFATVKKEQLEWLKKRDAASSTEDKCKLLQARIKALRELLW